MQGLKPEAQELLQLYYGQQLTQQAIADQMKMPQYKVSRHLGQARKKLLKALAKWSQEQWQVELTADLGDNQLTAAAETAIFRIVQEALSNVRKYAETERIRVELGVTAEAEQITLHVQDWGKGFDMAKLSTETDHLGVLGMAERAELVHGRFAIESVIGEGTTIMVNMPLAPNLRGRPPLTLSLIHI